MLRTRDVIIISQSKCDTFGEEEKRCTTAKLLKIEGEKKKGDKTGENPQKRDKRREQASALQLKVVRGLVTEGGGPLGSGPAVGGGSRPRREAEVKRSQQSSSWRVAPPLLM